jgi:class 3 adenylate cyclase
VNKKKLRIILLIWDIVAIILISFALVMMFETVIKSLLVEANTHVFTEVAEDVQAEYRDALEFLNEKTALPYGESLMEVFAYLKNLALNNMKYDHSLVMILGSDPAFPGTGGFRTKAERNLPADGIEYRYFHLAAAGIPASLEAGEYDRLEGTLDETGLRYLHFFYKKSADGRKAVLEGFPNRGESVALRQILAGTTASAAHLVEFMFQGRDYIGTAQFLSLPVGKGLARVAPDTWNPVIVVADDKKDFFFLINNVRNLFLAVMGGIVLAILLIKLFNTNQVTREIRTIAQTIREESSAIVRKGEIGTVLKPMTPRFGETGALYDSYAGLSAKLSDVGGIVSGIADRDLFTAVLKNDHSLLDPHEVNMAVLFIDVQGFTSVAEKHKEKSMGIINRIWTALEAATGTRGGKINKYMGDAALVIFPETSAAAPAARRAVEAAVAVIESVPALCKELAVEFAFRIGVDFGRLVYGKTGSAANFELGVIGDPVNTASRCEALNKKFGTALILTGEALHNAGLRPDKNFSGGERREYTPFLIDRARPKGKREAKELYTILRREAEGVRLLGAPDTFTPDCLEAYQKALADLAGGIGLWRETQKKDAAQKWALVARNFGRLYIEKRFTPAKMFLGRLLSQDEQNKLQTNPQAWLRRNDLKIKIPDEDWIAAGAVELEK